MRQIRQSRLTNYDNFPIVAFLSIGFSHHSAILAKAKTMEERKYYIQLCHDQQLSLEGIERRIAENAYAHRGQMPNNFSNTIADYRQAFRAIQMFKDEYLLDYINVEPLGVRDEDLDERVIENENDHWVDLLFFNRILRATVVVDLLCCAQHNNSNIMMVYYGL